MNISYKSKGKAGAIKGLLGHDELHDEKISYTQKAIYQKESEILNFLSLRIRI